MFAQSPDGQSVTNTYTGDYLTQQVTTINPAENGTTEIFYDAAGNITHFSDKNGGITLFTDDAEGNLTSLTDPVNNTSELSHTNTLATPSGPSMT